MRNLIKERYLESTYLLGKKVLGYEFSEHTHKPICDILDSITTRKLIVCPRGTFKSTMVCVAYPIRTMLRNPNIRILIDSELFTNSKNFLREMKAQLASAPLIDLFGDVRDQSNWAEDSFTVRRTRAHLKESTVTAGGIGTEKTGQHYDLIIMDDLNSPKNSGTPENREKVIAHYKMMTAILEPGGTLVVVGTRYAANDVIGYILENEVKK